jgi:hypothetical protein
VKLEDPAGTLNVSTVDLDVPTPILPRLIGRLLAELIPNVAVVMFTSAALAVPELVTVTVA